MPTTQLLHTVFSFFLIKNSPCRFIGRIALQWRNAAECGAPQWHGSLQVGERGTFANAHNSGEPLQWGTVARLVL
jgi:hypothetical protein